MPQWVYNILLPLFIAFAVPAINTVAEGGRDEQRVVQMEAGISRLLASSEGSRKERSEILQRQARTEERVAGLQDSVDRITTHLLTGVQGHP